MALVVMSVLPESARAGGIRALSTTPAQTTVNTALGGTPLDVAVMTNGSAIFVTTSERQLYAIDGALGVVRAVVLPGSGAPVALVATGGSVFVALDSGTILKCPMGLGSFTQQTVSGSPVDLAVDPSGIVFVATSGGAVHKLTSGLTLINTVTFPNALVSIRAQDANNIYVAASNGTIRRLAGGLSVTATGSISGQPVDITSDTAGNVIVATNGGLVRISPTISTTAFSAPIAGLVGVDMDNAGHVVAATSSGEVLVYNPALTKIGSATYQSPSTRSIAISTSALVYIVGGVPAIWGGDPHIVTVDGVAYDYHGAGEFVLLRTRAEEGDQRLTPPLEIQVRHAPVPTTYRPGGDAYTGIPACVSMATAVAARVGRRRITYQPTAPGAGSDASMLVRIDGVVIALGPQGVDLGDGGRVVPTSYGIEIDFPDGSVVFATPGRWEAQNTFYLIISLAITGTAVGLAGPLPEGSWLPALPNGDPMGPKPDAIHDRFVALYGRFGEAWRVTDDTSLFDHTSSQSTATYANPGWPSESGSCDLGETTAVQPLSEAVAKQVCEHVTEHKAECEYDVMATGHAGFATTYALSAAVRPQPRPGAVSVAPTLCSNTMYLCIVGVLVALVIALMLSRLRCRMRSRTIV